MRKHRHKKNLLKSMVSIVLTGFFLLSSTSVYAASSEVVQFSDYDLNYTISVPTELEQHVIKLSSSRLNVQFSDDVYLSLSADDYYDDLTDEEIGEYLREDFTIGEVALDDTYNDLEYMRSFFKKKLKKFSFQSKKRIESIELTEINKTSFWICHYYIYEETINKETNEAVQTDVGEGMLYFNMTDGITYYMLLNSNEELLALTPEALNVAESIQIGRTVSFLVYVMWGGIILLIVMFLFLLNRHFHFFVIEVEDEDGQTHTLGFRIKDEETETDPNAETVVFGGVNIEDDHAFQDGDTQITQVVSVNEDEKLNTGQIMQKIDDLKKVFADKNRKLEESTQPNDTSVETNKADGDELQTETDQTPEELAAQNIANEYQPKRLSKFAAFFEQLGKQTLIKKKQQSDTADMPTINDSESTDEELTAEAATAHTEDHSEPDITDMQELAEQNIANEYQPQKLSKFAAFFERLGKQNINREEPQSDDATLSTTDDLVSADKELLSEEAAEETSVEEIIDSSDDQTEPDTTDIEESSENEDPNNVSDEQNDNKQSEENQ